MNVAVSIDPQLVRNEPTARDAIAEIRAGHASPLDYLDQSIARIDAVDGQINALPVRCLERAREQVRTIMDDVARGGSWPMLHGLSLAVKDNANVGGVPTSGGSAIIARSDVDASDPAIALLERNGGAIVGKSNLSELGGANTVNAVLGATRNPHDLRLTVGGSSGGSAAALASGQVFFAHGNDVGGSLRTPASFCGVAGLRPTPGLVARKLPADPADMVFVEGPMARNVGDLALMFDAMVGYAASDPLSRHSSPGETYLAAAQQAQQPRRIAVSANLGCLSVSPSIRNAFAGLVEKVAHDGAPVDEAAPAIGALPARINDLRGANYATTWGKLWPDRKDEFTHEVQGDIARGLALSGADLAAANAIRIDCFQRTRSFFQTHDVLICPATQVMPFPIGDGWPREIDGKSMQTYTDWIAITYVWSLLACPAIVVPVGTHEGLPFGVQIVGPPHSEHRLLQTAAWLEQLSTS